MKLAIMQPYFLPYIGYWQLLNTADKFVVFDDVHFINRGWINRNRLLLNGQPHLFTLPLNGASQNRRINDLQLVNESRWPDKLLKTVAQAYRRAPRFAAGLALVEGIVRFKERRLAPFLLNSLTTINAFLGIATEIVPSSEAYENQHLNGEERILDICRQEGATVYLNPMGGVELYDKTRFASAGVELQFVEPNIRPYVQLDDTFTPGLSILDILMFNAPSQVRAHLNEPASQ